jgi:hypothetical protein
MGAWGYVSKNEDMPVVLDAIRRVSAGEFILTADAMDEQRLLYGSRSSSFDRTGQ